MVPGPEVVEVVDPEALADQWGAVYAVHNPKRFFPEANPVGKLPILVPGEVVGVEVEVG